MWKSSVSDVSVRILARMSVLVSASWNAGLSPLRNTHDVSCYHYMKI